MSSIDWENVERRSLMQSIKDFKAKRVDEMYTVRNRKTGKEEAGLVLKNGDVYIVDDTLDEE